MYKCIDCGNVFEEPHYEPAWLGECGDRDVYGNDCSCPHCGSEDFDEAEKCELCGEYAAIEHLYDGVCGKCLHECDGDFDTCYEISLDALPEAVKLNALLVAIFGQKEIEEILWEHVANNKDKINCKSFIEADEYWFSEKLKELYERRKASVLQRM